MYVRCMKRKKSKDFEWRINAWRTRFLKKNFRPKENSKNSKRFLKITTLSPSLRKLLLSRRIKSHWITPFSTTHLTIYIYIYKWTRSSRTRERTPITNETRKRRKIVEKVVSKISPETILPCHYHPPLEIDACREACREISLRSRKNTRHDRADRVIVTLPSFHLHPSNVDRLRSPVLAYRFV